MKEDEYVFCLHSYIVIELENEIVPSDLILVEGIQQLNYG